MTASSRRGGRVVPHGKLVRIPRVSGLQAFKAALIVCGNSDSIDALPILQALGLLPGLEDTACRRCHDRPAIGHGTRTAVAEHRRKADRMCGACRRWVEADRRIRAFREGRCPRPEPTYERCGTNAGAQRHYRRGERPCADCRAAKNIYQQRRRACLKARQRDQAAAS